MRFPWSKIYRAFPELDAYSDQECERYVFQVRRQRFGQWKYWLLGAGVLLSWIVLLPAVVLVGNLLHLNVPVVIVVCFVLMPLSVFIPGALLRDKLLIAAIRDRLNLARCSHCRHSLLGLPLLPGEPEESVRCPECGRIMLLRLLGLRHEELIPRQSAPP